MRISHVGFMATFISGALSLNVAYAGETSKDPAIFNDQIANFKVENFTYVNPVNKNSIYIYTDKAAADKGEIAGKIPPAALRTDKGYVFIVNKSKTDYDIKLFIDNSDDVITYANKGQLVYVNYSDDKKIDAVALYERGTRFKAARSKLIDPPGEMRFDKTKTSESVTIEISDYNGKPRIVVFKSDDTKKYLADSAYKYISKDKMS